MRGRRQGCTLLVAWPLCCLLNTTTHKHDPLLAHQINKPHPITPPPQIHSICSASLTRALRKYQRLNELALALVKPGGVLVTCSCSGAVTQAGLLPGVVADAAREAERPVTLLRAAGAAADHPLNPAYPEGKYLTCLAYRVL